MGSDLPARHVAYMVTPGFGAALAVRAEPALASRPFIVLDDQGSVLAADALAGRTGVVVGQTEAQAIARCPTALLRSADRYPIYETQTALMQRVAQYAGKWQPAGLGCAYLDTTGIRGDLLSWCQSLADEARQLGVVPSVGIATTKFGATVAGQAAGNDTMLLLTSTIQRTFLATQPTALLPLDADTLLHLQHLGIRTLGQYARLPVSGVLARFGEAGRTAQRWALGYDERSVTPPQEMPRVSARLEFEAPLTNRDTLLAALMRRVGSMLAPLHARLQAVGSLELVVTRGDGRVLPLEHTFPVPTAATETIRLALNNVLGRISWNREGASESTLTLGDITDAPVQQLSLLDLAPTPRATLAATLDRLAARFGPNTFQMAVLTDPGHPLPERRANWKAFG